MGRLLCRGDRGMPQGRPEDERGAGNGMRQESGLGLLPHVLRTHTRTPVNRDQAPGVSVYTELKNQQN